MSTSSRSRAAIEFQDVVAATFVVGTDLIECDFLTIQAALTAIGPRGGGYILVLEGSYDELLTFPLAPVILRGCGRNTVIAPTSAGEIFAFPDGMPSPTLSVISDLAVEGDPALAQTLFAYKDQNSNQRLITERVFCTGVRKIDHIQAMDLTYTKLLDINHYNANFEPTATIANNVLCETPGAAGSFGGAITLEYHDCKLGDEFDAVSLGWHHDFDGDLLFNGLCWMNYSQDSEADGFEVEGSLIVFASGLTTVELNGPGWSSSECVESLTLIGPITYKLSGSWPGVWSNVLVNGSGTSIIVNGPGWDMSVNSSVSAQNAGVTVDILAGADDCRITGHFGDAVVAAIRTAALRTIIAPSSFSMSVGFTVMETGAADYTQICGGSTGLSGGGGLSLSGMSTTVNGSKNTFSYSSTADAYATICLNANIKGLDGIGTIRNTHATRSLTIKESVVDIQGNAASLETVVPALSDFLLDTLHGFVSGGVGTGYPPFVSYKAEVKSTVAGQTATYLFNFLGRGAIV